MDSLPLEPLQYIFSFISLTERMDMKLVCRCFCFCIRDMTVRETDLPLSHVAAAVVRKKMNNNNMIIRYDRLFNQFKGLTVVDADGLDVSIQLVMHYQETLRTLSVGSLVMGKHAATDMIFDRLQSISFTSLEEKDFSIISLFPNIREFRITQLNSDCDPLDSAFHLLPAKLSSLSCRVIILSDLNRASFASCLKKLAIIDTGSHFPHQDVRDLNLPNLQYFTLHRATAAFICAVKESKLPQLKCLRVCSSDGYSTQPMSKFASQPLGLEEYHISFPTLPADHMVLEIPANRPGSPSFLMTESLIIDGGILSDAVLILLSRGDRLPSLKRLQLTDPENEFSAAAIIQFLKIPFTQRLIRINIISLFDVSDKELILVKAAVDALSLMNLKEADVKLDSMLTGTFVRLVPVRPTGSRIYSGTDRRHLVKRDVNPLIEKVKHYPQPRIYAGPGRFLVRRPASAIIRPAEMIEMLESVPGLDVRPSLRGFMKRGAKDIEYLRSLIHHPEAVNELIREGNLTDAEAAVVQNLVQGYKRHVSWKNIRFNILMIPYYVSMIAICLSVTAALLYAFANIMSTSHCDHQCAAFDRFYVFVLVAALLSFLLLRQIVTGLHHRVIIRSISITTAIVISWTFLCGNILIISALLYSWEGN